METCSIINDWQTWEACYEEGFVTDPDVVYTDHPYLYEKLEIEGRKVCSPAELIDNEEEKKLASFAVALVRHWQNVLDSLPEEISGSVRLGKTLGRPLFSLVNTVIFRAIQFEKILSRHTATTVPYLGGDERNLPRTSVSLLNNFNCNYYSFLAL